MKQAIPVPKSAIQTAPTPSAIAMLLKPAIPAKNRVLHIPALVTVLGKVIVTAWKIILIPNATAKEGRPSPLQPGQPVMDRIIKPVPRPRALTNSPVRY